MERSTFVIIFGLLAFILSHTSSDYQKDESRRNRLCWLMFLFMVVQNGFRDYLHSTNDTYNYYNAYLYMLDESLLDQFDSISLVASDYESRDPGFGIFQKITQIIWPDFRFLLVVVAVIIAYPLSRLLFRYTQTIPGIFIGMALYEVLFAAFFDTGMRQTIAMGLSYLAFMNFQDGKKWLSWLLPLFIAYTIHTTTVIFIPMFFLWRIENQNKLLLMALCLAPLCMLIAQPLIAFLGSGTIFEGYAVNSTDNLGTPVFTALVFLSALASKLFAKQLEEIYPYYTTLLSAIGMALMLTPSTWVNSNFIRLVFYYLIFLLPLLSVLVEVCFFNSVSMRRIGYGGIAFALIVLTL